MLALVLFLSSFWFFLRGASPALDGGDAGEFIASSHILGLPHAPGYPLYQLLGKSVQVLIPFASIALRTHVLSALLGSLTLVIVFQAMRDVVGIESAPRRLLVVLLLGLTPLYIEQARVAEVFLLNALFIVLILWSLQRDKFFLAAFLLGLALGNHQTILAVAPFLAWKIWKSDDKPKMALMALFFLIVGLSVYVYLPIRAFKNPAVNFGDPQTWERFWAVVTRKEFGALSLHPAAVPFRNGTLIAAQAKEFFGRALTQFGVAGLVLIVLGFLMGLRDKNQRRLALLCLVGLIAVGFGFELLSNLSPGSDIGQWRLERFFMIPLLCGVGLIAIGSEKFLALILIAAVGLQAHAAVTGPGFRRNFVLRDFATSALRSAPKDSRLVIDRVLFDEPTSAMLVATQVERKRADIAFLYRPGTLFSPIYGEDFLELDWDARLARQAEVERRELNGTAHPVRFFAFEKSNAPFADPVLNGLLYQPGKIVLDTNPFIIHRGRYPAVLPDYSSRLVGVHFPYLAGKAAIERGDVAGATVWFNAATSNAGPMGWLLSNIGGLYAQKNELSRAARAFESVVKIDPYFYDGWYGLGYVRIKANDPVSAAAAYERCVKLSPDRSEAYYMLGVAYSTAGQNENARAAWNRYLAVDPNGAMAGTVRKELAH